MTEPLKTKKESKAFLVLNPKRKEAQVNLSPWHYSNPSQQSKEFLFFDKEEMILNLHDNPKLWGKI